MSTTKQSRRRFLRIAGCGTALSLAGSKASAQSASPSRAYGKRGAEARFHLGLASYSLRKFDLKTTLAMTRRVGLQYICFKSFHLPLSATVEQIAAARAKVDAAGLKLYGCGVVRMGNEQQVHQAFEYAKAAGMTTIVASPSPGVLELISDKVKEYDICVAIHNHGPGDKVFPTPESAYRKIEKLDRRLGLCMDVGHTLRIGADPVRDVKRFSDRLLDVHFKDVTKAAPEGRSIEMGRGVIDIPGLIEALIEVGYSRVAAFEFEKDPKDPLPGLAESVGYARGVLATL